MSLDEYVVIALAVLGAVVAALRVVAPLTKWSGDNWLLSKLEWLLALVAVPGKYKSASLGGGKGGGQA